MRYQKCDKFNLFVYVGFVEISEEKFENICNEFKDAKNYELLCLKLNDNKGYAVGNNTIIRQAKRDLANRSLNIDYVLISNSDIEFDDNLLIEKMLEKMYKYKDCSVLGPKVLQMGKRQQGPYYFCGPIMYALKQFFFFFYYPVWAFTEKRISNIKKDKRVWRVIGCFMLIDYYDFEKIGYFDENTFLYNEEDIISYKFEKINKCTIYTPDVVVIHKHKPKVAGANKRQLDIKINSMRYLYQLCGYSNASINLAVKAIIFRFKFRQNKIVKFFATKILDK